MKSNLVLGAVAAILITATSTVLADGPHDKAIKARQAMFQLYSYHSGILNAMAKGKMEYNADLAQEAANNLLAAASLGQSTLWPQGSDNANSENAPNRALPAIWETYPAIVEKGEAMGKAAAAVASSAGNGLDALKASVGDVGAACKGCHDDFRAKRK